MVESTSTVTLPDGRRMDTRLSGPEDGAVLVFHHGTPDSVVPLRFVERAAHARGLRLLTMSRAGYGGSTRAPGRTVGDVVADTAAVLGEFGVASCYVAGWSGGGPHALACAASLPGTIATLVIAGVAPHDSAGLDFLAGMGDANLEEFAAAGQGETALRAFLDPLRPMLAEITADTIIDGMESLLPPVDQDAMDPEFAEDLAAGMREGLRLSVDGWLDDDLAFLAPWGVDLGSITSPVSIWQGSADLMVPFDHGRWLAAHVPGARAHLVDGEGHLSVAIRSIEPMLDELLALGTAAATPG